MSIRELTNKVKDLKALKAMAAELSEEITSLENDIKEAMTERGVEEMAVDVFKVRRINVVSNRFDTAAFKKTHADLYSQYVKRISSRRFSIV